MPVVVRLSFREGEGRRSSGLLFPFKDARKPGPYCRCHGVEIGLQAMVARHLNYCATLGGGWHPEWVSFPLHDQRRDRHLVEFVQAACGGAGAARRVQWKREAKHRDGAGRFRGAACDSRSQGPAADEERQAAQLALEQVVDNCRPSNVELARRSGAAPSGDFVGLLDERDADPLRARDGRHRHQVSRSHPAGGPMTEDKRGSGLIGSVQVGLRQTVRGVYFERRHAEDGCSSLLNRVWPVATAGFATESLATV